MQMKSDVVSRLGQNAQLLSSLDEKALKLIVAKWRTEADNFMKGNFIMHKTDKMQLNEFSTWFDFYTMSATNDIELPGQYTGDREPQVTAHARVVGFQSQVTVMRSLRKPIKLTIHSSDERSHSFLVKGGEDLRLDQRIQQLFGTMNSIFASDAACTQRSLALKTYQVIPLTKDVGMIEWLDNTEPIKAVILREATRRKLSERVTQSQSAYAEFIQSAVGKGPAGPQDQYTAVIKKFDEKTVRAKFAQLHAMIPADLLREGVLSLASSPEAFMYVRSRFTSSFAALSVASYIVGLGDRHLENFLLDLTRYVVVSYETQLIIVVQLLVLTLGWHSVLPRNYCQL